MNREGELMEKEAISERRAAVLSAWNSHDVHRMVCQNPAGQF